jgi:hypothetical protein
MSCLLVSLQVKGDQELLKWLKSTKLVAKDANAAAQ